MRIGIIGAMDQEVKTLLGAMQNRTETAVGNVIFHSGVLGGRDVVVARCGIGKVCAAMCVQAMIDRFSVDCVINTGVAGGLHPDLQVGDLVLCTKAVQHDFDVTALGYVKGYLCTGEGGSEPTWFTADEKLRQAFAQAAASLERPLRVREGAIASGDLFVSGGAVKDEIRSAFGADAAEMEGAAVAQVAAANGVPFLVVRAISDLADGSAPVSYATFEEMAAENCAALTLAFLETADGTVG